MSNNIAEKLNEVRSLLEGISMSPRGLGQINMLGTEDANTDLDSDDSEIDYEKLVKECGELSFEAVALSHLVEQGLITMEFLEAEFSEEEQTYVDSLLNEDIDVFEMVEVNEKEMKAFKLLTLDDLRKEKKAGQILAPPGWIYKLSDKLGKHILDIWWESVGLLFKSGKAFKGATVADVLKDPSKMQGAYGTATRMFKKQFAARYGLNIEPTKDRKMSINDMMDQFASWAGKMIRHGSVMKKHNPEVWAMIQAIMQDKAKVGKAKAKAKRDKDKDKDK